MRKILIINLILSLYLIANSQEEWTIIHPNTPTTKIMDIHFNSESEGWIVGQDGFILYTIDGGNTWESQLKNPAESYWGICFIDEYEGWVVGWRDIYHTTNKGSTWEKQTNPFPPYCGDLMAVDFINSDTGWIVGTYKTILKTTDGGENWTKQLFQQGNEYNWLTDVEFTDSRHGCAVGLKTNSSSGFILVTNDGGNTWTETIISPPNAYGFLTVSFTDSQNGWVSGYGGTGGQGATLHKTTDGGDTWQIQGVYGGIINDINFYNDLEGLLLQDGSMIRQTFDGGLTWDTVINTMASNFLEELSLFSYGCFAAGDNGVLVKSLSYGSSWVEISSGIRLNFSSFGFFNSLNGIAIGKNMVQEGFLLSTSDGGQNWSENTSFSQYNFSQLEVHGSTAFILEHDFKILKTINSGQSWECFEIPQSPNGYNDLDFVNNSIGFICGDYGELRATIDGGVSWENENLSLSRNLTSLYFVNENTGVVIDRVSNSILFTRDGCISWHESFIGENVLSNIFGLNDSTFFATSMEGVVYKTENYGYDWVEFFVFPEQSYNPKIYFLNDLEGWYINHTNIYHTYDGGLSWGTAQNFNEYGKPLDIFYLNDNSIWLAGQGGLTALYDQYVGYSMNIDTKYEIVVSPNPSSVSLNIELSNKHEKIELIELYDITGNRVHSNTIINKNYFNNIDISSLKNGIYVLKLKTELKTYLTKIIKN